MVSTQQRAPDALDEGVDLFECVLGVLGGNVGLQFAQRAHTLSELRLPQMERDIQGCGQRLELYHTAIPDDFDDLLNRASVLLEGLLIGRAQLVALSGGEELGPVWILRLQAKHRISSQ